MSHHFLQFNQVSYSYPNGYEALHSVSFRLGHGEKIALIGANGAGKSTLLLHCNGLLLPSHGTISIGGIPVERDTLPLIRQSVGMIFQNADDQLFMPTVEEDVAFGPLNMRLPHDEVERRVCNALAAVGATELRHRSPYRLSGGQKRSVAIATVLAMQPNILVMDEPSANLDPKARRQTIDLIAGFSHSCLIASHDMNMLKEVCERTIMMHHGTIIADGATSQIFSDTDLLQKADLYP